MPTLPIHTQTRNRNWEKKQIITEYFVHLSWIKFCHKQENEKTAQKLAIHLCAMENRYLELILIQHGSQFGAYILYGMQFLLRCGCILEKKNCDFWYFDKNCGLVFLFSSGIYDMGDLPGGGNGVWKCNIVFPWAFWLFLFFVRSNLVEMRTHLVKWKFFVWSVAFSFFFLQIFLFCFHQ